VCRADAQVPCCCRARCGRRQSCERASMQAIGTERAQADQRAPEALAAWRSRAGSACPGLSRRPGRCDHRSSSRTTAGYP
jgi:hypothetical protein